MRENSTIKSVAIVGAGAAGAITAAAFKAENYFERIQVFERREKPGGTWIYDADPQPGLAISPGKLPPVTDPRLKIPEKLPAVLSPSKRERFSKTPVYDSLTTNVPDVAMCFSDAAFAYGPFPPHYIPRQYIENYFSLHKTDKLLVLNTTVEDVSKLLTGDDEPERWRLTLRTYDPARHVDTWWSEDFDAVVLANGHYSVPYVPYVEGLSEYMEKFPDRIVHSKYYRSALIYTHKTVLVIGNSASGHDVTAELVSTTQRPVYQSRRSRSRWDGDKPPLGIVWKPVITEYKLDGSIVFEDGSVLNDIDTAIYCTGYNPSFPFWNEKANGRALWDYEDNKLIRTYWHTFFRDFKTLAIVGIPRTLTFRSFEYQAIALARLFSGRNTLVLPPVEEQERWEKDRVEKVKREGKRFHDIPWESGETYEWLQRLFQIAGLGSLSGDGRVPPVLTKEVVWALEHLRKYPEPARDIDGAEKEDGYWVVVERGHKDLLTFI